MIGTVISFSRMRGWGFLRPDGATEDVIEHRSELQNARFLVPGEVCEFQIGEHNGRRVAIHVWAERDGKD